MNPPRQNSQTLLAHLLTLHPKYIDLSLDRITRLLAALGEPQNKLPPVIHIAGTNGKGSTLAFLRAMLEADGKSVHAYTSPHLINFHERISLNGQPIDEPELCALLEEVSAANGGQPITFFEITTAAAFLAFSHRRADFLLLETGLGGRLDATNVIAQPALTLITPISCDHEHFLGDTLEKIAAEKAGILKKNTPAFFAPQAPAAQAVLTAHAKKIAAPCMVHGTDWTYENTEKNLDLYHSDQTLTLPAPPLAGAHQNMNAALAALAAQHLGTPPPALAQGITAAHWPARLQPLVLKDHPEKKIWLDGGHNPAAAHALADWLATQKEKQKQKKWIVLCAMLNTKHAADFFAAFAPLTPAAPQVFCVSLPDEENTIPADTLAAIAKAARLNAQPFASIQAALAHAPAHAHILICGSLRLAAHILQMQN